MKKDCKICIFAIRDFYTLHCDELKINLDIELQTGSEGGYVKRIDPPEGFYCSLFKRIKI